MEEQKELIEQEEMVEQDSIVEQEDKLTIDKGVMVFHDSNGDLRHQAIGEFNLENLTYYAAYINRLSDKLWDEHMAEGE